MYITFSIFCIVLTFVLGVKIEERSKSINVINREYNDPGKEFIIGLMIRVGFLISFFTPFIIFIWDMNRESQILHPISGMFGLVYFVVGIFVFIFIILPVVTTMSEH